MLQPESATPPFEWTDRDIAFVAGEISREFPNLTIEKVASAVQVAVQRVPPEQGRVALTVTVRQLLRTFEFSVC